MVADAPNPQDAIQHPHRAKEKRAVKDFLFPDQFVCEQSCKLEMPDTNNNQDEVCKTIGNTAE